MFSNIPKELKELNQWCNWKLVNRNGKETKIPIDSKSGDFAQSNNENTWSDYETSLVEADEYDGIGFFFKDPYFGVDIDNVESDLERYLNNVHNDNIVSEFVNSIGSYSEISLSGNGIHIIAKGRLPEGRRRKGNVEMYDSGRFFVMTGDTLGKHKGINEPNPEEVKRIYKKHIGTNKVVRMNMLDHGISHELSETEVVNSISRSKQSDMFKAFMNDEWQEHYTSQSEADLAFANMLAFWCARDFSMMDNLFRQSSLMRDKWDEKRGKTTYGEGTLYKAINETNNVYDPSFKDKHKPKYEINFDIKNDKKNDDFPNRSWDDTGNADRFIDRFGEIVKFSYIDNKFIVYNNSLWEKDDRGTVRTLVDLTVEDMKNEKIEMSEDLDQEEIEKAWQKHLKSSRSNSRKKAIVDELKHRVSVMPDEFDTDDMLLNADNGYLDLASGELHPHDINKMFSRKTSFEYTDRMDLPTWEKFLDDIFNGDKELIKYIQKAVGYSFTGSTKEQVMFILFGSGRNGKSVFVETISEVLGTYSKNIRADSLMVKQQSGVNNDIAALDGARFVTSSEPNEGFRFDEGLIKQLTGGDKITARFLYGEDFDFNPKFKLWVSSNHKPIIRGTDDGIWRRMILIPFAVQIPEDKMDKDLKYKLLREAPAILDWALEGVLLWQKEGLEIPETIKQASQNYRQEMDVLESFIADVCTVIPGGKAPAGDLFVKYKDWARENEEYLMSKQKFGQKMKEKFEYLRDSKGRYYSGLKIIDIYPGMNNWN